MAQYILIDKNQTDLTSPPGSTVVSTLTTPWTAHADAGRFRDFYVKEGTPSSNSEYSILTWAAAATSSMEYEVLFAYRVMASGNQGAVIANQTGTDSGNVKGAMFQVDGTNVYLSRHRGSAFSPSYLLMATRQIQGGTPVASGTLVWVRGHVSNVGTAGTFKISAWLTDPFDDPGTWQTTATANPSNLVPGAIGLLQFTGSGRMEVEYFSVGTDGSAAPFPPFPPDAPAVTVSKIRRSTVYANPDAYSHPQGTPQANRYARVRRVSSDAIEVSAHAVALSGGFYLTGLPDGPSGALGRPTVDPDLVVEVQDEDTGGNLSDWGTSAAFQTLNLWQSGEFVTYSDVLIERVEGSGTVMQSYSDFEDVCWVKTWRVEPAAVDSPIGSGTVSLARQVNGVSLAPLVTASPLNIDGVTYTPALDFGREITIVAGIAAPGSTFDTDDYVTLMRGITDDIEWPRKVGDVTVPFRDFSGRLGDTMMRSQQRYGSEGGVDALEVMQAYVDVHMGAGQYTITDLTVGDRFLVTDWTPSDVYVMEGLGQVALMWGGKEIRQVEGTSEALLAVVEPNRTIEDADYAIGPDTYIDVSAISTAGKYLRTIVRGRAVDKETGETITSQLPMEEDVDTDPLVNLYGPIFFQFDEEQAKGIDTQGELDAMVAAIYADLSTPPFPMEISTKFCPFVRVGDYVEWLPDTILRDESLKAAVLSYAHESNGPGIVRTLWRVAGKPKGRYATYQHLGLEVAGIGKRPTIFGMDLDYDSDTKVLTVTNDFNPQVNTWRVFDRIGASPKTAGVVDTDYATGEYFATQLSASWSVYPGVHHVLVRAFAVDRTFVDLESTITVSDGGGDGEGPGDTPGTPSLRRGVMVGDLREVIFAWINTNEATDIELEYYADDEASIIPLAPGVSTYTLNVGPPVSIKAHVRYNDGDAGAWSGFSVNLFIPAL